jgi:hypothetical protein
MGSQARRAGADGTRVRGVAVLWAGGWWWLPADTMYRCTLGTAVTALQSTTSVAYRLVRPVRPVRSTRTAVP